MPQQAAIAAINSRAAESLMLFFMQYPFSRAVRKAETAFSS
jgi:hypothetical protein